eukprot:COSAG06_NODE_1384_length_9620_cov_216.881525_2_plen_62_part_00
MGACFGLARLYGADPTSEQCAGLITRNTASMAYTDGSIPDEENVMTWFLNRRYVRITLPTL